MIAVAILSVAALLAAFLVLTVFERRRGARVFSAARLAFDEKVSSATKALVAFDDARIMHAAHEVFRHALHSTTHHLLIGVRFLERLLTRVVRNIRTHRVRMVDRKGEGQGPPNT